MKIFLLRHTEAGYGPPDPERTLTPDGRRMAAALAEFVRANPWFAFEEIWCSPYQRARQTAAPFAAGGVPVELLDHLTPGADPAVVERRLKKVDHPVLVVGHNPHLAALAGRLLGAGAGAEPPFRKGELFAFKRDAASPTGFTLAACLPPGALGLK